MPRGTTKTARKLRRDQTNPERLLWRHLRGRRFRGIKFRGQVPIAGYVADLVCERARLIIEIDGGQHSGNTNDAERTAHLEAAGYAILRFWNNDVITNTNSVLEQVEEMLALAGHAKEANPLTLSLSPWERGPDAGNDQD
jgi:very-short-patch-repair endonuclease